MVELINIHKEYPLGRTKVVALRNIKLSFAKGDSVLFIGPSGSGKTTLLNLIGLIDLPTSGTMYYEGRDVKKMSRRQIRHFRKNKISFIFQTFNLIPVLSAYENIEFPLILNKISRVERQKQIAEIAEKVNISSLLKHRPDELSGGQRQRVAIARAIVVQPEIIIADEPTANLDTENAMTVIRLLTNLNIERRTTIIAASHDPRFNDIFSRTITIIDGSITS